MQTGGVRARALSWWFYLEGVLGSLGVLLFVLTLVWKDWIELVFRIDPDEGNGAAEYLVVFALLAIVATSCWLARTEWRAARQRVAEQKSWMG